MHTNCFDYFAALRIGSLDMSEFIVDTSDNCLMNCKYCGTNSSGKGDSFLSANIVKLLLNDVFNDDNKNVLFLGGGTFFCHPKWKDILLYNKTIKANVIIDCPISKEVIEYVRNYPMNEYSYKISLSLWGVGKLHDNLSGRTFFNLADSFIDEVVKYQQVLRLSFVITKELIEQQEFVVEFIKTLPKLSIVYFHRLMPSGRCTTNDLPVYDEVLKFCDEVKSKTYESCELLFHHTIYKKVCLAYQNRLFINHDCKIYGCGWITPKNIPIGQIIEEKGSINYRSFYQRKDYPFSIEVIRSDTLSIHVKEKEDCILVT